MASCSDTEAIDAIVYEEIEDLYSGEFLIVTLTGTGAEGTKLDINYRIFKWYGTIENRFRSLTVNRKTKVGYMVVSRNLNW